MNSFDLNRLSESDPRILDEDQSDAKEEEEDMERDLIILGMESKIPEIKEKAVELNNISEKFSKKEEEFRCQVLHIETITMMAKYQLIYIKMENFWKKLERLINCKFLNHKAVGFFKIKKRFIDPRVNKKYVFFKLLNGVEKISHVVERKEIKEKSYSFSNIFSFYKISNNLLKERMKILDLRDQINNKQSDINKIKKQISEGFTKNYSRKNIGKISTKEKMRGSKKNKENNEIILVYNKLKEIKEENGVLASKIKITENKAIKFMQEISDILKLAKIKKGRIKKGKRNV